MRGTETRKLSLETKIYYAAYYFFILLTLIALIESIGPSNHTTKLLSLVGTAVAAFGVGWTKARIEELQEK